MVRVGGPLGSCLFGTPRCTVWYILTSSSVIIDVPALLVWDVFVDVERWSEWTTSITRITPLDGAGIEVGRHFEIKQPRLPSVVWEVTEIDNGVSWTWRARSLGNTTFASHEVVGQEGGRTLVRQCINQRGPFGVVVGVLIRRLTRRYLELEAQGLKRCCERLRGDASTA